jgi:hypothetical protein
MYVVVLYIGREFSLAESKHEESLAYHNLSLEHKNHRLRSPSIILKPAVRNMKKTEKKSITLPKHRQCLSKNPPQNTRLLKSNTDPN